MIKAKWLIWPVILLLCGPVSADFYKYKDKDGNIRFTDDISNVPVEQRPGVQSYEESEPAEAPVPKPVMKKKPPSHSTEQSPEGDSGKDVHANKIKAEKEELDKSYQALVKEKEQLAEEKKNLKTRKEIKEFNRKIAEHNEKIYQWEQRRKAYNAQVEAYNARSEKAAQQTKQ